MWPPLRLLTRTAEFLDAAKRTISSIGAFRAHAAIGILAYPRSAPTEKQPRGFRIDPTGRFMVVSGEKSETITSYSIVQSNGSLVPVGTFPTDRKSTRLNSSHRCISYAFFRLKNKKRTNSQDA